MEEMKKSSKHLHKPENKPKTNSYLSKNPAIKNILLALAVAFFGFILLNVAFLFDALFQSLIDGIVKLFTSVNANMDLYWYPPLKHFLFVIIISIISWFVFRSKLKVIYKATFMTVPLAVVYATIAILFYPLQIISYLLGSIFGLLVLFYLYRTKQPWLYYYTLILVSLAMLMVGLLGVEI